MNKSRERLLAKIRAKFTKEDIELYKKHFGAFDLNHDGAVSARELERVSRHMGYRMSKSEIKEIMRATDLDESGDLNFEEFLLAMPGNTHISSDEHRAAEIRRKFMEYDRDHNGHVTLDEAHSILRRELAFSPQQSAHVVSKYDKNGDGKLSYEEFVDFYKKICTKANEIRDLFHEFDKDHSGSVSVAEAKLMLDRLQIPEAEVEGLVKLYDMNKDGELQYEEFVAFLLNK